VVDMACFFRCLKDCFIRSFSKDEESETNSAMNLKLEKNEKWDLLIEKERECACELCLEDANMFFSFIQTANCASQLKPALEHPNCKEIFQVKLIDTNIHFYTSMAVNQAIAIELYLKALLLNKKLSKRRIKRLKTHDISCLYGMLDKKDQKRIYERYLHNGGNQTGKYFNDCLDEISDVFVYIRYAFEMKRYAVNTDFLSTFLFTVWECTNAFLGHFDAVLAQRASGESNEA
jgi:hypothetical protein